MENADRVQSIMEDCLRRWSSGESFDDDEILATNQDLHPELGEQLRKARRVMAAAVRTPSRSPPPVEMPSTWSPAAVGEPSRPLSIRCPYCRSALEIPADIPFTNLRCDECHESFSIVDPPGELAAGRPFKSVGNYDLLERLGVGAFATVWKAQDIALDREVAVKIPRRSCLEPLEEEQFLREARVVAQLRHPHIVTVHEVGRDDDTLYIVSDLVRGINLSAWLEIHQPTFQEAALLCQKLAAALHHAHEAGIVHRDLKPSNIMIDEQGEPHVTDFGLAKRDAGEVTMTCEGNILGTPTHMSPEQVRGDSHAVDGRTDVYSLGVILYQLLTGELPFRGSVQMLLHQVVNDDPPEPRYLNHRIPRDLQTICLKCLEKEPARRYGTAAELSADLVRFQNQEPIVARPLGRLSRLWRWCRRKPTIAALGTTAVALVLVIASGAVVFAFVVNQFKDRATVANDRTRRVLDYLVQAIRSPDPWIDGRAVTAADILDRARTEADRHFHKDSLGRAMLLDAVGQTYHGLGLYDAAVDVAEEALRIRQRGLARSMPTLWSACTTSRCTCSVPVN